MMVRSTERRPAMGYLSRDYALALSEWGEHLELPRSGGWLLTRPIAGTDLRDAMGCYPLFCCQDWRGLRADLDDLKDRLVSVTLVTDPFGDYDEDVLRTAFDRAAPFKDHYYSDLALPVNERANFHHRKHARRALKDVAIEVLADPRESLDDWGRLYSTLTARHRIGGIRAFSRESFAAQLRLPGMVAIRAVSHASGETTGMQLWLVQGQVVYSHLSAYSEAGYKQRVAYALNWSANAHFTGKVPILVLGAGAGTGTGESGLTDYKRGWSTGTRPAWLCGRVLQSKPYAELTARTGNLETNYFPAYRRGEF